MPERFKVVCTMQGAIQVLSFTFTFKDIDVEQDTPGSDKLLRWL